MTLRHPSYPFLLRAFRNSRFWLAWIFAIPFGLLVHQYFLASLWPLDSVRIRVASGLSTLLFFSICFALLDWILASRFPGLTKAQKTGIILASVILLPVIFFLALLDLEQLSNQYLYVLLPSHTIEVQVLVPKGEKQSDVALKTFYSEAQGYLSLNAWAANGWDRVGDELVLTDPANNQLQWQGKTGQRTFLVFRSQTPVEIVISWDNTRISYDLSSQKSRETRLSRDFEVPLYAGWPATALVIFLCTAFLSFGLSVLLVTLKGLAAYPPRSRWTWLLHALPMYLLWSIGLFVFWPGFMSADSMSQWGQVVSGEYVHANPVGHTLTMWLITRVWFSPAAVALAQIAALGGVLGWGIATLRDSGAPAWLAWLITLALTLSPANAVLSITIWKDVLFSTAVVALTILVFKLMATEGRWLEHRTAWISLGVTLVLVSIYRLNGVMVAAGVFLPSALMYGRFWRPLLKTAALFLFIYYAFTGPVFRFLNVEVVNMGRDELILAHLLAGHMRADTYISPAEQALLGPAMPEYPWPYRCHRNTELIFTVDRNYLVQHSPEIRDIAWNATLQNPMETLRHFACQAASVYRIPQEYPNEMLWFGITENEYGLQPASLLPGLSPFWTRIVGWLTDENNRGVVQFVWRMPFWMYFCMFGCLIFCLRNRTWTPLLVLVPGLVTVLPYLLLTLGQIFRYVYSMYLIGILFGGYFLLCRFRKADPDSGMGAP